MLALTLATVGLTLPEPAQASSPTPAQLLGGGFYHSVAVQADGGVWAWGSNSAGQLGDGTTTSSNVPVAVAGLSDARGVAAGGYHSLAVQADGRVRAWGYNAYGQLGDGTTDHARTPVQVSGLGGVTAVAGGNYHSLALNGDGSVSAWGYNGTGQLGDGTATSSTTPVSVQGLTGVIAVAAGGLPGWSGHSIALKADGTVWAWGYNKQGQLGDGTGSHRATPVQVTGLTDVVAVDADGANSYALKADGTVWGWGDNSYGQLGNPDAKRTSNVPVQAVIGDVVAIAAGGTHVLAVRADGTAWAWGNNNTGQLGTTNTRKTSDTPVQVHGLTDVTALAGGYVHSLGARGDGTAWAWGRNVEGQLGDGTNTTSFTPVQVQGLAAVTPPERGLEVTIDSPQAGAAVDASEGWFTIAGTATGGSAALRDAVLLANGEQVAAEPIWGSSSSEWSMTVMPPQSGDYRLEVVVTDEDGREGRAAIDVTISNVPVTDPSETIVSPLTEVLDDALLATLTPVTYPADTLRFTTAEVPFGPGAVLVAGVSDATPEGLLVRVLDLVREGDQWVAIVEQASLDDAFVQVDVTLQPPAEEPVGAQSLDAQAAEEPTFRECLLDMSFDNTISVEDEARDVTMSFAVADSHFTSCIEGTFRLRIERKGAWWDPRGSLTSFESSVALANELQFNAKLTGKFESWSWKLWEEPKKRNLKTVVIPVGKVPVVIKNVLEYNLEGEGSVDGSLSTAISGEAKFKGGMAYTKADGWHALREYTPDFTYGRPTFEGVKYEASFGPALAVHHKFYGVAGPKTKGDFQLKGVITALNPDEHHFKASLNATFKLSAEFPKALGRFVPSWSWTWADPEFMLWEGSLGRGNNVAVIAGEGDEGGLGSGLIQGLVDVLTAAGYQVQHSSTIPASLDGVGQLWWVDYRPFPSADVPRLVQFVNDGGGLYMTGERPCCETLNARVSEVVNQVVSGGSVQIGGLGDPYYATGPVPTNPTALDGLTSNPFTVTEWVVSAPGGMAGVSGANVLASAPGNDVPVAAAWNADNLTGNGRMAVLMDVNWLHPSYKGPQAYDLAQNLALFLSGLSAPPGDPVMSMQASGGAETQTFDEPAGSPDASSSTAVAP